MTWIKIKQFRINDKYLKTFYPCFPTNKKEPEIENKFSIHFIFNDETQNHNGLYISYDTEQDRDKAIKDLDDILNVYSEPF